MDIEIRFYFDMPTQIIKPIDIFFKEHPKLNQDKIIKTLNAQGWYWIMCNPLIESYWLIKNDCRFR